VSRLDRCKDYNKCDKCDGRFHINNFGDDPIGKGWEYKCDTCGHIFVEDYCILPGITIPGSRRIVKLVAENGPVGLTLMEKFIIDSIAAFLGISVTIYLSFSLISTTGGLSILLGVIICFYIMWLYYLRGKT